LSKEVVPIVILSKPILRSEGPGRSARGVAFIATQSCALGSPPYQTAIPQSPVFLTPGEADVRFENTPIRRGIGLSRPRKPHKPIDLPRRDFLVRFCQGAGATLVPGGWWKFAFPPLIASQATPAHYDESSFHVTPHYRGERPLDTVLRKVTPGLDEFRSEKYASEIDAVLSEWSSALRHSPFTGEAIANSLSENFSGTSWRPGDSRVIRSDSLLEIHRQHFDASSSIGREAFLDGLRKLLEVTRIVTAEFQITRIDATAAASADAPVQVETRIRYGIVGTSSGFHREQRIGNWELSWTRSPSGQYRVMSWRMTEEMQARSHAPVYIDVAASAFDANTSYAAQMMHGTDYWRTILDGASGIDIYGHNGVSVADIDNDGFDDLYVCQPAGLPNRLYRNRGDGTFEDITESSGLGILENTACALFADFSNRGWQDVVLVRTSGPVLFINQGNGKFHEKRHAFQFANPPQGTFTGAALADYDRDGWLDVYFCLYSYYQGTGQYRYPSPYHDAENGPPNFMMRNNRDGTFRDVTADSGLNQNNTRYSFACGWSDFNDDGWPDLYVVNDFGRKNLYRNNGDRTFTDIAAKTGAEDVGAGMSVGWLDYDNDGAPDLYVANMWTAAGVRTSMQENFKKTSSPEIRALYQKHAMGNSLLRNRRENFEDVTSASGVGMGRWSWSSDALDFDHDGYPDLYITNGMVSGPDENDLNSFFWRQVVSQSPDDARASKEYEQGWSAINELIRSDGTWSGYERNVCYANNRDGTFSDVSAAIGLDFVEDGRSFALADVDHDGRLEICLKNRNAPQLRLLKNVAEKLPASIAFRLQGTKSNRDAIGAAITIETSAGRQTRMLQAGSGFLSQHSKIVSFGLGDATGTVNASIVWPSGAVQRLQSLPANHAIWVEEGKDPVRVEAFRNFVRPPVPSNTDSIAEADSLPTTVETWLLTPIRAPQISLPDVSPQMVSLSSLRGKPVLLNFWNSRSRDCRQNLQSFQRNHKRWADQGLRLLALHVKDAAEDSGESQGDSLQTFAREQNFTFPMLEGSEDVSAVYNILYRQLYDRHRDLILPTSFLINSEGDIVKVYQGRIDPQKIEKDFRNIPSNDAERLALGLPFPLTGHTLEFGRNYLSLGALFFQRGYLDEAEAAFQRALRDDPASAEALYGIGSVYLNQNKNAAAHESFGRATTAKASYPDTLPDSWNNLGVIATREGRIEDSVAYFKQALQVNPHHLAALENLGNAYRLEKSWDEARTTLEQAVAIAPEDPEANYSLGMVYAQTDETAKADEYLHRALASRPVYPEALNNLGVLYLVTQRPDQAVSNFEQCIRVAPAFDQAYLNLARVYAIEGARDKARGVLLNLLKQHPDHAQAKQMLNQLQE
jgi:tetratricopeptide (TPR) repeat protein